MLFYLSVFQQTKFFNFLLKSTCCLFLLSLASCSTAPEKGAKASSSVSKIKKPHIIVILTDQERYAMHWPEGWAEANLPSSVRLKKHGLTFRRAYTAACECSPSRAVLTTGEYFPINKVSRTPAPPQGLPSNEQLMDIGLLLKEKAGYDVIWKGKWHLSPSVNGGNLWSEQDIAHLNTQYSLAGWNPPDAGNAIQEFQLNPDGTLFSGLSTLGGGYADNDSRYIKGTVQDEPREIRGYGESILSYLARVGSTPPEERQPFCLFISLVNPHDIWVYPNLWEKAGYKEDFAHLGIDLPPNYADDLTTKPSVQLKARNAYNAVSTFQGEDTEKGYVNFYAYLNKLVDQHIETILNALDTTGLTQDTIIIRTADHGELGLSHGMREKSYTVYEEMIHIPLIISNPNMYPFPQTTDSFYSHLDLLPTLAELAHVPHFSEYGRGVSIVPILKDPSASVQDSILFTYDDVFFLPADVPGGHIRAIRAGDWTYAVYYSEDGSHFEYEMYHLKNDPGQLVNLLYHKVTPEIAKEARRLHHKLKRKIDQANALPKDFPWPASPFSA